MKTIYPFSRKLLSVLEASVTVAIFDKSFSSSCSPSNTIHSSTSNFYPVNCYRRESLPILSVFLKFFFSFYNLFKFLIFVKILPISPFSIFLLRQCPWFRPRLPKGQEASIHHCPHSIRSFFFE